jgi:hypothetical protein
MKIITRFFAVPVFFIVLFASCNPHEQLQPEPEPDPYSNCVVTQIRNVALIKIPDGSPLKVGDWLDDGSTILGKVTEIIDFDGQKYALGQSGYGQSDYAYDTLGRVKRYVSKSYYTIGAPTYEYEYAPGKIIEHYQNAGLTAVFTQTLILNEYGIIPEKQVTYNKEGYEIERIIAWNGGTGVSEGYVKYTIANGNAIKAERLDFTGKFNTTNEYDLTKPNVPNPRPFIGKKDRNLLQRATVVYQTTASDYLFPKLVSTDYRYTFDSAGKVTRIITISTYEDGKKNMGANEYYYKCK